MAHSKFELERRDIIDYANVDWKQQWRLSFALVRAVLLLASQVNELVKVLKKK